MKDIVGEKLVADEDLRRSQELKRLQILDTLPEITFDNIAKQASEIFNVSVSLISFVDIDNVFYKANVGIGPQQNYARGITLCSFAIQSPKVTVLQDIHAEPCQLGFPVIAAEFGLKFYASAPLITKDGLRIGTISILDEKSRPFSEKDEQVLVDMANSVMQALELRIATMTDILN